MKTEDLPRRALFPWRYQLFLLLLATVVPLLWVMAWHQAIMAAFDLAAFAFLVSVSGLVDAPPEQMRKSALENDVNRVLMLLLTGLVSIVVLVAVGAVVQQKGGPGPWSIVLVLVTLILAWLFSNLIYAMHYAHIFYRAGREGHDSGGLDFPKTPEPAYWEFLYFAFTLGMTFQTSDVAVESTAMRQVVLAHCLAAFVFNLGVLAFTINVLGGS